MRVARIGRNDAASLRRQRHLHDIVRLALPLRHAVAERAKAIAVGLHCPGERLIRGHGDAVACAARGRHLHWRQGRPVGSSRSMFMSR